MSTPEFIKLPEPAASINADDAPGPRYEMLSGVNVLADSEQPVARILDTLLKQLEDNRLSGKLPALVINCHGFAKLISGPHHQMIAKTGYGLKLGNNGITWHNTRVFAKIRGRFERIFLVACGAAAVSSTHREGNGELLCKDIARHADASVIASTSDQVTDRIYVQKHFALRNYIDQYEGDVFVFTTSGRKDPFAPKTVGIVPVDGSGMPIKVLTP